MLPNRNIKLLYISGTYYPANAGAEISAHTLLRLLQERGILCKAITKVTYDQSTATTVDIDGVETIIIDENNPEQAILDIVSTLKPNVILTQLMWSDIAIKVAAKCNIPSILRVCKIPYEVDISISSLHAPTEVFAVSKAAAESIFQSWGRKCAVIPPPIELNLEKASEQDSFHNPYITMFNPIRRKGGHIFRQLAILMPSSKFAFVPGWHCLRDKRGNFDTNILASINHSLGIQYHGEVPEDIKLNDIDNIITLNCSADVRSIYSHVKVLCVPSIWEEAFGRVAIEAFMYGIPVLGSPVGGLREHIVAGGILIEDHLEPRAWIKHLVQLESRDVYDYFSNKATTYVEKYYDLKSIVDEFITLTEATIVKHEQVHKK